jgi:hypothetical protein
LLKINKITLKRYTIDMYIHMIKWIKEWFYIIWSCRTLLLYLMSPLSQLLISHCIHLNKLSQIITYPSTTWHEQHDIFRRFVDSQSNFITQHKNLKNYQTSNSLADQFQYNTEYKSCDNGDIKYNSRVLQDLII